MHLGRLLASGEIGLFGLRKLGVQADTLLVGRELDEGMDSSVSLSATLGGGDLANPLAGRQVDLGLLGLLDIDVGRLLFRRLERQLHSGLNQCLSLLVLVLVANAHTELAPCAWWAFRADPFRVLIHRGRRQVALTQEQKCSLDMRAGSSLLQIRINLSLLKV
jgi:hypothetical protein